MKYGKLLYFYTDKIIKNIDDLQITKLCVLLRKESEITASSEDLKIILAMLSFYLKKFIEQKPAEFSLLELEITSSMYKLDEIKTKNKIFEYTEKCKNIDISEFMIKKRYTNKRAILKNDNGTKIHICLSCNIELQNGRCPKCKSSNFEIRSINISLDK